MNHGGFGTDTDAREELRAEISAIMNGEQLGVGHEPRHGTAYVSSWIKALENDPREIRAAAVDAQRISDWLISRERERSVAHEKADHERPEGAGGPTPERELERPRPVPQVGDAPQAEHVSATRVPSRPVQVVDSAAKGGAAGRETPAMSENPKTVRRDVGAAGYRAGAGYGTTVGERQTGDAHRILQGSGSRCRGNRARQQHGIARRPRSRILHDRRWVVGMAWPGFSSLGGEAGFSMAMRVAHGASDDGCRPS